MLAKRPSTTLLTSITRVTGRPTGLPSWASKPVFLKARRHLIAASPLGSDGSRVSSATIDPAAEKDSNPAKYGARADPDPALPIVEYDTLKGRERRNVKVSAKTNPDKLVTAVAPLLSAHTSRLTSTKSVACNGWQLQPEGDTLVRFFAFESEADATQFVASVGTAADKMDHHPGIAACTPVTKDARPVRCVAVSCSTHRPPGLSMRDVRLARKVDELAEPFNYMASNTDLTLRTAFKAIRRDLIRQLQRSKGG